MAKAESDSDSPTSASPPFDERRGDVILQSCDKVNFWVLKSIIAMASPVFDDMFSLPQPPSKDGSSPEVPVIQLSESSSTLDTVLRLCYPIKRPQLDQQSVSLKADILRVGLKYNIEVVVEAAQQAFQNRVNISEEDAISGYAIACSTNREEEARIAAVACLRWPALGAQIPQLAMMTGLDHYNLLDFHRRACAAIEGLLHQGRFYTITCPQLIDSDRCSDCKLNWRTKTKYALADALKDTPTEFDKLSSATFSKPLLEAGACGRCKDRVFLHWNSSRDKMIQAIRETVATVEMSFSWK